jgi:mRNA interferase RelE/StbE
VAYKITIKPSAQKDLDRFSVKETIRIAARIKLLENNPRPVGVQKLTDEEGYRIRSGKYRILYVADDKAKNIFIYRVKHRKEVYKK